jgi:DNA-binding CsgD family transcriptional regulator
MGNNNFYLESNHPFDLTRFKKIWKTDITDAESLEIDEFIKSNPLLNQTMVLHNTVMSVINLETLCYLCLMGDIPMLIGYTLEEFMEKGVPHLMTLVPPDNYLGLEAILAKMNEYIAQQSDETIGQFRTTFDFSVMKPDKKSIVRLAQDTLCLKRSKTGYAYLILTIVRDITNFKLGEKQHIYLTNGTGKELYEFRDGKLNLLETPSARELEIASLIGQQYTSEEIANKLFISKHTVNTHRQNMLEKTNLSDTTEVVNLLKIFRM